MAEQQEDQEQKPYLSLPSPIIIKRSRTISQSERARQGPTYVGKVIKFDRNKGHGFIVPDGGEDKDAVFVHVSDIEEEYVPETGDRVRYNQMLVPPKNEKYQAVHVHIIDLAPGVKHHKWTDPNN